MAATWTLDQYWRWTQAEMASSDRGQWEGKTARAVRKEDRIQRAIALKFHFLKGGRSFRESLSSEPPALRVAVEGVLMWNIAAVNSFINVWFGRDVLGRAAWSITVISTLTVRGIFCDLRVAIRQLPTKLLRSSQYLLRLYFRPQLFRADY
jgi:hypothetical protein